MCVLTQIKNLFCSNSCVWVWCFDKIKDSLIIKSLRFCHRTCLIWMNPITVAIITDVEITRKKQFFYNDLAISPNIIIFGDRLLHLRKIIRLHRCWWRMLETKCVGDNFKILVSHTNGDGFCHFGYQRSLSFNISVGQQHPKDVTKIVIPFTKLFIWWRLSFSNIKNDRFINWNNVFSS